MSFKGLSQTDVQNLSAMLGCTPVCLDDSVEFIKDSSFDGEELFKNTYSQVTSAKLKMSTTTAYHLMEIMSSSGDNKNAILRKALAPAIAEKMSSYSDRIPPERMEILQFVLHEWIKNSSMIDYPETCRAGISSVPVMRITLNEERVPERLTNGIRIFLKSLFQINNLTNDVPLYPPETIERLWDEVMPDTGIFSAEICPQSKKLSVIICNPYVQFTIGKNNDACEDIIELLLLESRLNRIKNSHIDTSGVTIEDEYIIQELKSVESDLIGDRMIPHELSKEGHELIRKLLQKIEDVQANMTYPSNIKLCTLTFDLDSESNFFTLDGIKVCVENQSLLMNVIRKRLVDLAKDITGASISDEKNEFYLKINEILNSGNEEIDDRTLSKLIRLNASYDYCVSLDICSELLYEEIITYLLGMKEMSFTIPSMLLTLLNCTLSEKSADELLSEVTGRG